MDIKKLINESKITEEELAELWKQDLHRSPPDSLSRMRQAAEAQRRKILRKIEDLHYGDDQI